jgi:hypothetical protein
LAVAVLVVLREGRQKRGRPSRLQELAHLAQAVLALLLPSFWLLATHRSSRLSDQLIMTGVVAVMGYGLAGTVLDRVRGAPRE